MQAVITLANGTLLVSMPAAEDRSNMSVLRLENGATRWISQQVYPGPSAYSSLVPPPGPGPRGEVGLAYERDHPGCGGESCAIAWTML